MLAVAKKKKKAKDEKNEKKARAVGTATGLWRKTRKGREQ